MSLMRGAALFLIACGSSEPPPMAPPKIAPVPTAAQEVQCKMMQDTIAMRVCRSEAKLRIIRQQGKSKRIDCYDDKVSQMHAAYREREHAQRKEAPEVGLPLDERARLAWAESRIVDLWDQIQSGACQIE